MELIFIDELAEMLHTTPGAIKNARWRQQHVHLDLYNKGIPLGFNGKLAWRKSDVTTYLNKAFNQAGK